jgi:cobaltochelatase CobN
VPVDLYDREWERRRWRNRVHLTIGGCLGPCVLSNVTMLMFDGRTLYFQSLNSEALILELLDYVDAMLAADAYLPPPPSLAELHFTAFRWEDRPDGHALDDRHQPAMVEATNGFLFLTHSDTDLLVLSQAVARLPEDFPKVRASGLGHLKTDSDVDAFLNSVLPGAEVIVVRLMGGRASFPHGLDQISEHVRQTSKWLLVLPGTDALDPELTALSTTGVPVAHEAFAYLQFGGVGNYEHLLRFLADHLLAGGFGFEPPAPQPRHGVYHPRLESGAGLAQLKARHDPAQPTIGVLFYRSHLLSGNTAFIDAIVDEVESHGANALPVFAYSLKETTSDDGLPDALRYFADGVDVVIATTSFAMGQVNPAGPTPAGWSVEALEQLDVPVLQAIAVGSSYAQWDASQRGLTPLETAMNVALPEFDGRIITVPISFKELVPSEEPAGRFEGPVVAYVPRADRIERVVGLAMRQAALRRKPNAHKRLAVVLTNYNAKASRIGNAVGLDTPASVVRLLHALADSGYDVGDPAHLPVDGDALLSELIDRCSYDVELLTDYQLEHAAARVATDTYIQWFSDLPEQNQRQMASRWGPPPGESYVHDGHIALAGLRFGNVFVAIQPPRGYGIDPNLIYHQPDLPPTHSYHALYRWIRDEFGTDAMIHVGKHGTLEWLPGKAVGLSEMCYPDQLLGDVPLIYPFIINDPGEGAQAKRRAHAVIVDHLTPPMTTADAYGRLDELARLVDEYYQVEALDPSKLPMLQRQIWDLVVEARLDADINLMIRRLNQQGDHTHDWDPQVTEDGTPVTLAEMRSKDFAHLIENLDGYLCELGSALIRGGLHTLGERYTGDRLRDLVLAMVRVPNLGVPGLRTGVAAAFGLQLEALTDTLGARLDEAYGVRHLARIVQRGVVTASDALEAIDALCIQLVDALLSDLTADLGDMCSRILDVPEPPASVRCTLEFIRDEQIPKLETSATDELHHILTALEGRYVPAGPSGAPTRGMAHVLPTGRNFYAIDPRSMPSHSAWSVGQQLASELVERHLRETGTYPRRVGLSIWGTSAMRTHGDDIAQVFALLGVRPIWQPESQRLEGVEVVPLAELGRPRVDVVCRISGFFRDAFPHVLGILDDAVTRVCDLDEPSDQNPLRALYLADRGRLQAGGLDAELAERRARYRIFGSKPGTYGAGILPLIDEGNWQTGADFASAYINWGGYAYTAAEYGTDARSEFEAVLSRVEVAAKNQDNREHDIFDSDDYLQFHGGMIATIRALSGSTPRRYFGDSADPARVHVRDLKEEALRVFRTRVVNPKWIARIQEHGYKGALELAATVDYLFGYDATADVLDDWMYEEVTRTYVLGADMQAFFACSNPWALKDMSSRLLEAMERGMWSSPPEHMRDALERAYLQAEEFVEGRAEQARPVGART